MAEPQVLTNDEMERAKRIALSLYQEVDYSRTQVDIMSVKQEVFYPHKDLNRSVNIPIEAREGFELAYSRELDRLFIGKE